MEFSDLLTEEHKPIRRALNVLESMAERADEGHPADRHDVNALLVFLHYFADACHQAKEERVLFPMLKQARGYIPSEELNALMEEHDYERSLIEKTQVALFSDNQSEFVVNARKLIGVLSGHATKEEQVLFPLAEKMLSGEEGNQIAARIHQFDADFGASQRKLLIDMLKELERKYMPKAA